MTPFALSGLLILITSLSLGVFILLKTPSILTNRLWAYFNFAIALWGLSSYEIGMAHNPQDALLWLKIGHVGVIVLPIFLLHFTHFFLEIKNKLLIIITYLIGALFIILLFTNLLITKIKFTFKLVKVAYPRAFMTSQRAWGCNLYNSSKV